MGVLGLHFLASTYIGLFITLAHLSSDFSLPAFCLQIIKMLCPSTCSHVLDTHRMSTPPKPCSLGTVCSSLFQDTCTFRQTRCPLVFYGPSLSEAEASSQPLQWYERELCHDPHLQMRELAMCYGLICVPPSSNVEVLTSSTSEGDLVWR